MTERFVVYMLAGGLLAALLWRMVPASASPLEAAVGAAGDTMGQPASVPTLPAELIIGQSLSPGDGDAGPVWYTAQYPGDRPGMPAIPSAVQ